MRSQNIKLLEWEIFKNLPLEAGITTRTGGYSSYPYDSFNLALHTGDNPVTVGKNRDLLTSKLNINSEAYVSASQVHGTEIEVITEKNQANLECDALLTSKTEYLLNIFVADCVPIALYDWKLHIGALCHCGWKGTYGRLLAKMIDKIVTEYNSNTDDILIGIGPSIGSCCYNVSEDLYVKFNPGTDEGYIKDDKYYLDLKRINRNQALNTGIPEKNVEVMDYCTSCSNDLFYSYRKEGEPSGRFSAYLKLLTK